MNSEQFDIRKRKVTRSRIVWPFRRMAVNEVVTLSDGENGKSLSEIQIYCHVYGNSVGKTFETFTEPGVIYVKRVS